jgi:hypothetical protein
LEASSSIRLDNLIAKLSDVSKSGDGYVARCPAHDDSTPSLSFGLSKTGKIVIHCHAGCTLDAIALAIGLDKSTLLHGQPKGHGKKAAAGKDKKAEVLPPGEYLCRIVSIREDRKSDDSIQWAVKFLVASGEHKGNGWIYDTWKFDAQGLPHIKHACKSFGFDMAGTVDLQREALEGKTCVLTIEQYPYEGIMRNRIARPNGYAPAKEIVYDYLDAAGTLLFQVVRLEPKAFYQRRPNGRGGWIYSIDSVSRVPYRLPELIAAPGTSVWIAEGEKDCNNLAVAGFLATTNPGGSSAWSKLDHGILAQAFAKRKVYVLPDNDEAGTKHATEIAASLSRIATEIRIVHLPGLAVKEDVSDWFAAAPTNTAAVLMELCEATAKYDPDLVELAGDATGHTITNFQTEEYEDEHGAAKKDFVRIPIKKIIRAVLYATNGWPKRLGRELFIDRGGEISFLNGNDAVFAHLHEHAEIRWMDKTDSEGRNYVLRGELVCGLSHEAPCVDEITETPMEPEPKRVYITRQLPKSGNSDGSHFAKLISFFRPASDADEALLCALALTPFWGGSPGTRPLMVLTGPEGIGQQETGKTSTAIYVTAAAGHYFGLALGRNANSDPPAKQLLSDTALRSRVVLCDNLTGFTDSADLAELITLPAFDGRPAYGKPRRRLNYLTWIATAVAPQFTRDLASRSFVVHLTPPDRAKQPCWEQEVSAFVRENRDWIIADSMCHLRDKKAILSAAPSRFPAWDREVLACHEAADKALGLKVSREKSIDMEEEALALFLQELRREGVAGKKFEEDYTAARLTEIWNKSTGNRYTVQFISKKLREYMAKGKLTDAVRPKWPHGHGTPWVVQYGKIETLDGIPVEGTREAGEATF